MSDHIYVILVAFLAVLGCFTAAAMVGVDPTVVGTLRDALLGLGGAMGGFAYGKSKVSDTPTKTGGAA